MNAPIPPRRIHMHFDVVTDDPAAELTAAYEEIIARARIGLLRIVKAIEETGDWADSAGAMIPWTDSLRRNHVAIQIELTQFFRAAARKGL